MRAEQESLFTLYVVDQIILIPNEAEVWDVHVVSNQRYENQNGADESEKAQEERARGHFTTETVPHPLARDIVLESEGNLFHC